MARTLPLMLSYYHLQAPFVNESYTQSSCRKTCGILLSCQESKTKTIALCLLCANTLHAKCQSLTTFIVTSHSLRTQHSSLLVKIFYPRNKIEFICSKECTGTPDPTPHSSAFISIKLPELIIRQRCPFHHKQKNLFEKLDFL